MISVFVVVRSIFITLFLLVVLTPSLTGTEIHPCSENRRRKKKFVSVSLLADAKTFNVLLRFGMQPLHLSPPPVFFHCVFCASEPLFSFSLSVLLREWRENRRDMGGTTRRPLFGSRETESLSRKNTHTIIAIVVGGRRAKLFPSRETASPSNAVVLRSNTEWVDGCPTVEPLPKSVSTLHRFPVR